MKAFTTARLGSDMAVKYLPSGDPVGEVSLAVTLMKKDAEGKRMTQWIKAALFGKRAESLSPYLTKGSMHAFHLSELHIDSFAGKDGNTVSILKARIDDVELCGSKGGDDNQAKPAQQPPRQPGTPPYVTASGFDDMSDDIPFLFNMNTVCDTLGKPSALNRAKHGKGLFLLQTNKTSC